MLRNIAGIMADEEPKTPISASGYYNMSRIYNPTSSNIFYDDLDLNGLGEFTIMFVYNKTFGVARPIKGSYTTGSGGGVSDILTIRSGSIEITFRNSGGGNTTLNHSVTINSSQNYHIAIVGSLIDNTIKLYIDGVSVASNTMNYSIASDYLSFFMERDSGRDYSIGQFNVYDRALTDSEILEHWVYDDVSLSYGVLGWNAMTTGQRADLICSLSCIKDVSYAGNEFSDKSVNNVTLSPKPSLTGDQIYVYTDANDLPSGGTTIYSTLSADMSINALTKTPIAQGATSFAISAWVYINSADMNTYQTFYRANHSTSVPVITLYFEGVNQKVHVYDGSSFAIDPNPLSTDTWYHVVADFVGGSYMRLYVDGVMVDENLVVGASLPTGGSANTGIGVNPDANTLPMLGYQEQTIDFLNHGGLSQAHIDELYYASEPNTHKCFDDYSAPLKALMTSGYEMAEWTGNTGNGLIDQIGSDDLNDAGTTTYVSKGLKVECTS